MKKISLLGCGWLGFPLATSLVSKGFSINGSTTSLDKILLLEQAGIHPFQINLLEDKIEGKIDLFLQNSEILIIDVPPKLRGNTSENFIKKIQNLIPFIEKSTVKKVLFVSSTSVYADENATITEDSKPQPDTESGKQLLQTEQLLLNNTNFQTFILRFGGLIGENRHPIRFLSGKENIENPEAPINLIHQEDCIGIIEAILQQANNNKLVKNEIFNAVAPFHPTRKVYYTQKAIDLNLPLPEFEESKPSVGKLILSSKVETILKYKFKKNFF